MKQRIHKKYGTYHFLEKQFSFNNEKKEELLGTIKNASQSQLQALFDDTITDIITIDGLKLVFENSDWLLIRLSGTEPVARLYAESKDNQNAIKKLDQLGTFLDLKA